MAVRFDNAVVDGELNKPRFDELPRKTEQFHFSDYQPEVEDINERLGEKIKKHGEYPKLLLESSRTKGIPNQRKHFTLGPSDRIGTNFTPTAKHLTISGLRERKRLAWLKRKEFLEMYGHPPGQEKLSPPRKVKKRLVDTEIDYPRARHPNLPKLRNRPAESFKRRQSIFASTPKRIIIEEGLSTSTEKSPTSSLAVGDASRFGADADSVVKSVLDRRKKYGQEEASKKLHASLMELSGVDGKKEPPGADIVSRRSQMTQENFLQQFPYKICQRSGSAGPSRKSICQPPPKKPSRVKGMVETNQPPETSYPEISDEENDELLAKGKEMKRRGGLAGDTQMVKSIKAVAKAAVESGFELFRQEQLKKMERPIALRDQHLERRVALIDDEETRKAIRKVASKVLESSLAVVRFKKPRKNDGLNIGGEQEGSEEESEETESDEEDLPDDDDRYKSSQRFLKRRFALIDDDETLSAVQDAALRSSRLTRLKRDKRHAADDQVLDEAEIKSRKYRRKARICAISSLALVKLEKCIKSIEPGRRECFVGVAEASQPSSPTHQLTQISRQRKRRGLTKEQFERYMRYVNSEISDTPIVGLPKKQWLRIKTRLDPKWFHNIMLKKKVHAINAEFNEEYYQSERKSIVNYVLLDPDERERVNLPKLPDPYRPSIIRAPVPWRQSCVTAKQFCRHNLFITNQIVLKIRTSWEKRYKDLRFVNPILLKTKDGKPLPPNEMKERVFEQCSMAKTVLMKKWLPEIALFFVTLKDSWKDLVPSKKGESLGQVQRFFCCVRAMMSINLRSMAIESLIDFVAFMKTYSKGNDFEGDTYREGEFLIEPMLTLRLLAKKGPVEFSPSLDDTKAILVECLKEIVQSTHHFPRIEKELFPEMRSTEMHLLCVRWEEDKIQHLVDEALDIFDRNTVGPNRYISLYGKYTGLLSGEADQDKNKFLDGKPVLKDFEEKMESYSALNAEIASIRGFALLNMFELDCADLNKEMSNRCLSLRNNLISWQVDMNRTWNRQICNQFDEMATKLGEIPEKTKDLVELQRYLKVSMNETLPGLMDKISVATQRVLFLLDCALFPTEDIQLNTRVFQWPKDMASVFELAKTRTGHRRDQVEEELRGRIDQFEEILRGINRDLEIFMKKDPPVLTMDEMRTSVGAIDKLDSRVTETIAMLKSINQEEVYLDWDPSAYPLLEKISLFVQRYSSLWHTALDFHENYERWYYGPFKGLDTKVIQTQVEQMYATSCTLSKIFYDTPAARRIADTIRTKIEKFRAHLPVLHTLCNPGLRDRHWAQICLANGGEIAHGPETSLHDMIEAGLHRIVDKLEEIGSAASKEFALETAMEKMKQEWQTILFECNPYRESGVSILSGVEDVQQMLDDHILKAQTMHSSAYIKPFEEEMKDWEDKLISMQDILDAWLRCQESWLYLEPIFNSEDIMKQMPVEGRKFNKVDRIWRNIMAKTVADPRVLQATNQPNMLQNLQEANELLDEIMKGLNDYLEKKRLFFPRFFFLSNDELLEILSETKDPLRVQPHVKKCFEGIDHLKFQADKFGNQDVIGMVSAQEEEVPFSNIIYPADAKGMVEKWLLQVEKQMMKSLQDIISSAVPDYFKNELCTWVTKWAGQAIVCARSINWTAEVTESIQKGTIRKYAEKSSAQLKEIVDLVRNGLSAGLRNTLRSLLVVEIHAQEIIELLDRKKISKTDDFSWMSQLRYYLVKEGDENLVRVNMVTTSFDYGFEYLGNPSRLVITPLTERCYRTMMGAIKLNLGGSLQGPAGSGKTETCKDLAKAVAKQCVVFNCSDGIDFHAMGKFLKGLAQSGAWACFDEFNRIELDVLSVVAQQIHTIHMAVVNKVKAFEFEGAELTLNASCCIFITMNPDPAMRRSIPDNLKLLFRPVAMVLPDVTLISEVVLYSNGFHKARILAKKIVETYRLCSEQLSFQPHYDYGLRAVKAVLTSASKIKMSMPEEDDEIKVVLKALYDVNLPKFVHDDVSLFKGITQDLFPKKDVPVTNRNELKAGISTICAKKNLQASPYFIDKILQLYEMLHVQHGIMLVGEPMSCKTKLIEVLSDTLTYLSEQKDSKMMENRTIYKIINPKSITMTQLYGIFDPYTHEWSDGVLGSTFRDMATSTTEERKWIVFDGPVDSEWIENLNTVLDDSKKLCLMNGEIIHLSHWMNLIFETGDLVRASPATVGRCGMVFLEGGLFGWKPLKISFLKSLPTSAFNQEVLSSLDELFEWLVQPTLIQVKKSELFVPFSELHLVNCMLRLLDEIFGIDELASRQGEAIVPVDLIHAQTVFLFCLIWGVGSTMHGQPSKHKFDVHFRNLVDGLVKGHAKPPSFKLTRSNLIPDTGSVFDYTLDPSKPGTWISWIDYLNNHDHLSGDEECLIVPTAETAKQTFFLNLTLNKGLPLGLIGPSGTGKSFITNSFVRRLSKEKFVTNVINFSARTSVNYTQEVIMSKLDRRRKGVFGPAMGKKCIIFIDDIDLPQRDDGGSIPPVELLRQWIDHGYWYDKKDTTKLELLDVFLLAAMSPPGSGRSEITTRFLRHLNILSIDSFDDETLRRIFNTEVDWHFKDEFDPAIIQLSRPLVEASLQLYKEVQSMFLPTPAKCHYIFNLRDFAKVIEGVKAVPHTHLRDPNKLIRLWCHEVYRVYYDRLVDEDDRGEFFNLVRANSVSSFKVDLSKILFPHMLGGSSVVNDEHLRSLCFGDYMHPEAEKKVYDEIPDTSLLTKAMEHYLKEYNTLSKAPMPLVMFKLATEHTSRSFKINRIIKQPGGHALLVGVGGSGRKSLAKLATYIAGYEIFQIEVNKTYGVAAWRNDLKKVLKMAGADCKKVVFLFTDEQIKDESFLEDISMVLNTGEVPNLFATDEKTEILERVQATSGRDIGGEGSFANLYGIFLQNIKRNLHIILCMSPIGGSFRNSLRMFPALVNCCTIDWFTEWPSEALEKVAGKFLEDMDMEDDVRRNCVVMCGYFHESVRQASFRFYNEIKRHNYVTPTSYLALLGTFKSLLKDKKNEIINMKSRYEMGLGKLEFASNQVGAMQNELTALRPQLLETSDETERLMIKIEQDTIQVEAKKEIVACDEALANEAAAAAQAIRDDCENDLAEAIPALQAAVNALDTLSPSDITVVKTMKNPAPIVKFVVEAICVMKGVPPDRKPDPENKAKLIDDFWTPGQKMMGDIKFLDTLRAYDKDNIPQTIMKRIREKYVTNPYFDPNFVKKVSTACEGLCKWVRAIEVYDRVIKIVSPKKAKLAEAEQELARQMDKLNEKRAQLQQVTDKLQALNDEFAAMTKKKKDLEDNIELCSQKLDRAEKLIYGLGGERDRWSEMAVNLGMKLINITGDVLLASGAVAYLGAFNVVFRNEVISDWQQSCRNNGIQCSEDFSLANTLGEPVQIRQWQIAGLPKDQFSVDNGVIVANARRWPLMIDPQGQARKWIKNMEKENNLCTIKYTDPDYMISLQDAIHGGRPALLENVGEQLDSGLESILLRHTFISNGMECILLGDSIVEYNSNFKLYIVTDYRNPHFPPEVAVKVTLLNFMITPEGLQDQLLGILAAEEKPELEEMKNKLIVESANNKKQLNDIEEKILKVLSSSQGNILEDETAIHILSSSKILSEEIAAKQKVATDTENEIDQTRDGYRPVAIHASILFFSISELANIDPMYQFSLPWFIGMYHKSIRDCVKKETVEERIVDLNAQFTRIIYRSICRSLFQEHVLVFSFVLCVGVLQERGEIQESVWLYLLRGARASHENLGDEASGSGTIFADVPNPLSTWLPDKLWHEIVKVSRELKVFESLQKHVTENGERWQKFYDSSTPHEDEFPDPWNETKNLERLILLRCFRPDKLILAVRNFVTQNLGREFSHVPSFDLASSYSDSDCRMPIILILSPGSDPLSSVQAFKPENEEDRPNNFTALSLGQGQGAAAEKAILEAAHSGGWVLLMNCHLAVQWMSRLVVVWEDEILTGAEVHPSFRLWLTSYATANFPSQLLQSGIKISLEFPRGLRSNMSLAYNSPPLNDLQFYSAIGFDNRKIPLRRLLYGMAFFHGVLLERHNYGPVGWNDCYDFSRADLAISLHQLHEMFLKNGEVRRSDKEEQAILDAVSYLVTECNYGGHVTDDNDRRLLKTLITVFVSHGVESTEGCLISETGFYRIPVDLSLSAVLKSIEAMDAVPLPEAVGLNENAAISRDVGDSEKLLAGVRLTQPMAGLASATEDVTSASTALLSHVGQLIQLLPQLFDLDAVLSKFPISYENSLNTVIRLEVSRYNNLLRCVRSTLIQLEQALKGEIVMSIEMEEAYNSINRNKIPVHWRKVSYPSQWNLTKYLQDLQARIEFFKKWIKDGKVDPFWIGGMFFPQSFLTSVLQNFARKNTLTVEQVEFEFELMGNGQDKRKKTPFSVLIDGIYLEGARWDHEKKMLAESLPKIHHDVLPPLRLIPKRRVSTVDASRIETMEKTNNYCCPVYRTFIRTGELLSTGHSTNYIFSVDLPTDKPAGHWINRGVAGIAQKPD